MKNCLNCGKEVVQTPGKKEKKYCDAKCKQQHWHKLKADKKDMVKISREEYDRLIKSAELTEDTIQIGWPGIEPQFAEPYRIDLNTKQPITKKVLITKKGADKPVFKELDKEGPKPYNPNNNPASKTDIEVTYGGRNAGKTQQNLSYLKKRQQSKLNNK